MIDLGQTPLANAYLAPDQATTAEPCFPLRVMVCDACLLAQVEEAVPAEAIFQDYAYFSSYSSGWVEHARRYAEAMIARLALGPNSLVMEVASNDGYLLRHFRDRGVRVLGIEPARNVAAVAVAAGIPTETRFFNATTAALIVTQHGQADLIAANNVLAHVPDIAGFVAGFALALKPDGVVSFEFPHLMRLIAEARFDTIYHEHYSYLSLLVVERALRQAGLRAFDVARLPTHGGSLRVLACHAGASRDEGAALGSVRAAEREAGLDRATTYDRFAARVAAIQAEFRTFLARARAEGRRIGAYGAAAKGNTFLNCCGITASDILWVADRNPVKQGKLLPGSHIPIVPPEAMRADPPDDLIILPWNLAAEVATQEAALARAGTRFWVASPEMRRV
jgi:SAM-dependent methyltransferase